MKIHIGPRHDPDTTIHSNGRDVTILGAFSGPVFTTDTGETLGVCMRDSGYEIVYRTPRSPEIWLSLNDGRIGLFTPPIEELCEVMHDAYEAAAADTGWETQEASRKPWADVPEANKATMRGAVQALLDRVFDEQTRTALTYSDPPQLGFATTRQLLEEIAARCDVGSVTLDPAGVALQASVKLALDLTDARSLDYRTVDS